MAVVNLSHWRGRRVLVTGHSGFIGGWLSLALQSLGAKVTGYALPPPTNPSLFEAARVADGMVSTFGDVADLAALTACMGQSQPEVVFHLAAQPLVRRAHAQPVATFATNVMGTVNLLEAVRSVASVTTLVVFTTDKVYENREWIWGYRENDALGGKEPYGVSKACCEMAVAAYRHAYLAQRQVAVATVRAGNVIGGGDWAEDRLVPDAMRAFVAGQPLAIRNPAAIRPWQHVLEPVRGLLQLAERLAESPDRYEGGWNFGPAFEDSREVSWIADQLTQCWGDAASWQLEDVRHRPYEARLLALDSSKARSLLDWHTRFTLEEAIAQTVSWYRAFYRGNLSTTTEHAIAEALS